MQQMHIQSTTFNYLNSLLDYVKNWNTVRSLQFLCFFFKLDFPKLHSGFDPKDVCFFKSRGLYLLIIFHFLSFILFYLFHMFLPTRRVIIMIINMDWAFHLILTNVKSSYHMTSMVLSGIYKYSWSLNSTVWTAWVHLHMDFFQ